MSVAQILELFYVTQTAQLAVLAMTESFILNWHEFVPDPQLFFDAGIHSQSETSRAGDRGIERYCPGEHVRARIEPSSTKLKTTTKVELIASYSPDAWALSRSLTISSKPELRIRW